MLGFAEYMESTQFQQAVLQLVNVAARLPTAIMCAERLPSNCHRTLIADYLVLKEVLVQHLVDNKTVITHRLSEMARTDCAELIYDRNVTTGMSFR